MNTRCSLAPDMPDPDWESVRAHSDLSLLEGGVTMELVINDLRGFFQDLSLSLVCLFVSSRLNFQVKVDSKIVILKSHT